MVMVFFFVTKSEKRGAVLIGSSWSSWRQGMGMGRKLVNLIWGERDHLAARERMAKEDDSLDFFGKTLFVFSLHFFLSVRGLRCLWVFLCFVEEAVESH